MQIWPELAKAPKVAAATAASRSASSSTTKGALPPSSSTAGLRYLAQVCAIRRPTWVEPVKFTRRSAGCATMASTTAPASAGALVTKFTTPAGSPASCSASMIRPWVAGHSSEPLSTTVLPQASGVAIARTPRITGAFQGAMPSTTPAGWRTAIATEPGTSEGRMLPSMRVVSAAASSSMPAARCTLKPAQIAEAPVSAAIAAVKASARASSACAAFISSARRSPGPVAAQAGKAAAAASTAATASAAVAAGARVATPWSSGLRRSKRAPSVARRRARRRSAGGSRSSLVSSARGRPQRTPGACARPPVGDQMLMPQRPGAMMLLGSRARLRRRSTSRLTGP
jgi:hypothetical protein